MTTNEIAPHSVAILVRAEVSECDNTGKMIKPVKYRSKTLSLFGKNYQEAVDKLQKFMEYIDKYEEN